MLKACLKNFLYIVEHKLNVMVECWKLGLYLQGIQHDLSKLSPVEFFPYAKKFFAARELSKEEQEKWQLAWRHHQRKNKHHWEHWVIDFDSKKAAPMPRKYLLEMVCDWRSFSRKWGKQVKNHHLDLSEKIILHPDSRRELMDIIYRGKDGDSSSSH
ncbi:DUF5662 family protein [Sutcliffiella rhizosphaerae]|uniref:Catalase n=1 Tax=Sutcliffiella rhizosphaerae TaxID=2880967 RepID=A0ABM8YMT0_9BACI|nr:DUF5662 family protein [Sutcliffiella rhizosphaerae]CAG9621129.1 hypothetical protein BACCIP111883_01901 [Sutcliffiella rhizosphaerae]